MVATTSASFVATGAASSNRSNSSGSNVVTTPRGKEKPTLTVAASTKPFPNGKAITSSTIIHSPTLTQYPPVISSPRSDFQQHPKQDDHHYGNSTTVLHPQRIRDSAPKAAAATTTIPVVKALNVHTRKSSVEVLPSATGSTETTVVMESKRVDTNVCNYNINNSSSNSIENNDPVLRDKSILPNAQIPSYSSISSSNADSGGGNSTTTTDATSSSNINNNMFNPNDDTVTDDSTYDPLASSSYSGPDVTTTFDDGTTGNTILFPSSYHQHNASAEHEPDRLNHHSTSRTHSPKRTNVRIYTPKDGDDDMSCLQHQCDATAQCSPYFGNNNTGHVFFQSETTKVVSTPKQRCGTTPTRTDKKIRDPTTPVLSNDSTLSDMTTHSQNKLTAPVVHVPMNHDDIMNDATTSFDHYDATITSPTATQNSSNWWMQMFQQLESKHAEERTSLQQELQTATMKQSQYKSELKNAISQQLLWIERRMMLPQHILPNLKVTNDGIDSHSPQSTFVDDVSSANLTPTGAVMTSSRQRDTQLHPSRTNMFHMLDSKPNEGRNDTDECQYRSYQNHDDTIVTSVMSYNSQNMGVEMTYDSALQVQRVQELEKCLTETIQQYHNDRLEWMHTLEEAAKLTTTSEQILFEQQEEQIASMQSQIALQHKQQKKQWKEKIRVLTELLKLTEQKHTVEQKEWDQVRVQHETTIRQLMDDMNDIVSTMDTISKENNQYQRASQEYQEKMSDIEQKLQNCINDNESERIMLAKQHDEEVLQIRNGIDQQLESLRQELRLQHQRELEQLQEECKIQQQKQVEQKVHFFQLNSMQEKDALVAELDTFRQKNNEYQTEIEQLKLDAVKHQRDMEAIKNDCEKIRAESNTFRTYAADFTEQATVSRNQCTVLQKNLALAADQKNPDKSSPSSLELLSFDLDNKLDRALAERDLYQQEVASLKSGNMVLQQQVSALQKQLEDTSTTVESDRRITIDHPLGSANTNDNPDDEKPINDLAVKYKESVATNSELVTRLKRVEEQRLEERSVWKVQLESALADNRSLRDNQTTLDRTMQQMNNQHDCEINGYKVQLQQARTDRKRQFDELLRLCGGTDGSLNESQVIQHLHQRIEEIESVMEHRCHTLACKHSTEVQIYKNKIDELNQKIQEAENEIGILNENHFKELSELQERFEDVEKENADTILNLQLQTNSDGRRGHDDDDESTKVMSNTKQDLLHIQQQRKFEATLAENNALIDRVDELSKELVDFKRLHYSATKKYERAILDRNGYKDELETLRRLGNDYTVHQEVSGRLERHQFLFLNAIDELREDMTTIRQNVEAKCKTDAESDSVKYDQLREDLVRIQHSLNDAVAEITLDADAMIQSRDVLQIVASDVSEKLLNNESTDKHERLLSEVSTLCEHMKRASIGRGLTERIGVDEIGTNENFELSRELISELQQKEAALAVAQTELRYCKEQLESEIASRQIADSEIISLHEQADVYEEEISLLQLTNKKLVSKLRDMGIQLDASLLSRYMQSNYNNDECNSAIGSPRLRTGQKEEDSLNVLDEALALAEDLTNIVHCRSSDKEQTAMEMLESMSEMMEVHELRSASQDVTSPRSSPRQQKRNRRRHRKIFSDDEQNDAIEVIHEVDDDDDDSSINWFRENNDVLRVKPTPIETTPPSTETTAAVNSCKLQLVVEQLYGRCQLLERERVEMMEVTLDLLESAREANQAQIEAALATARRKTTEDIIRVRDESRQEQERIFHKLCKSYVVGTTK